MGGIVNWVVHCDSFENIACKHRVQEDLSLIMTKMKHHGKF